MAKNKFYVVWVGQHPGIYDSWEQCKIEVTNFPGAKYKAFNTCEAATMAYRGEPSEQMDLLRAIAKPHSISIDQMQQFGIIENSLSVDAACSGNPGIMEYRGVYTATGQELFRIGPLKQGTNNIGEFLALVHGLAYLKKERINIDTIYSDSVNAQKWVAAGKCRTKLTATAINAPIFNLIARAEFWLANNTYDTKIIKWDTNKWGEIPADFGRK